MLPDNRFYFPPPNVQKREKIFPILIHPSVQSATQILQIRTIPFNAVAPMHRRRNKQDPFPPSPYSKQHAWNT